MTQYEKDLAVVKHDGFALEYIKKQTSELCLEAVKQNGLALQFVKKQTQKVCLAAVKQNGWALQHVKNQTPKICLEAVKQKGSALQYVKDQTPELLIKHYEDSNGLFSQIEEAFKRNEPMKVTVIDEPSLTYIYYCPHCGATLMVDRNLHPKHLFNYCGQCGQKLDWRDKK